MRLRVPSDRSGTPATSRPRQWLAAAAMGLVAAVVVAIGTGPPGPGLDPDAQSYVGAAVSLVHSGAYRVPTSSWAVADTTEPMTHFPPGLSTVIAGPVLLGVPPLQSARLVIIFAAFASWTALVAFLATAVSLRGAVLTGLAVLCTPAILTTHLSVLSEPLFLTALLLAMTAMMSMASTASRRAALWAGVFASAAVMLRYAGLSVTLAALWWSVMAPDRRRIPLGVRIQRAGLAVAPTVAVLAPWLIRSVRLEGASGVRRLGAYGEFGASAAEGIQTLASWLVPLGSGWWPVLAAALIGLGAALLWQVSRPPPGAPASLHRAQRPGDDAALAGSRVTEDERARDLIAVITTTLVAYVGFVAMSRLIADPSIPFDERILAPALLLIELVVAVQLARAWEGLSKRQRAIVDTLVAAWMLVSAGVTTSRIVFARQDGNDFAGSDWRDSPTIAWVRAPTGGANRVLYSNWPPALYFQAHRPSHDLPATLDRLALHRFHDRLVRSHGAVVAFAEPSPDVAPPDSIARLLGLATVARFVDGTVWEIRDTTASSKPVGRAATRNTIADPRTTKASS